MWLYFVILAGAVASRALPLACRYRMAGFIADLLWLVWRSKRRNCIANMSVVLDKDLNSRQVKRVARQSFRNFGKGIVDFLGFSSVDPSERLLTDMPVTGLEHLHAALDRGHGVVLATAHFGSIDLGGLALAQHAPNFFAVADTFRPERVDRLVRSTREAKGFQLIPTTGARRMITALHDNGLVVVLFDRPLPGDEGVPVRCFGRRAYIPAGSAILALRTGAAIVPAFVFRESDNSLRGRVFPAVTDGLPLARSRSERDANVRIVMQRLADALEAAIREAPDQWYMFRRMWPEARDEDATGEEPETAKAG